MAAAIAAVNCNLYKPVSPPGSTISWIRAAPDKISTKWRGFHSAGSKGIHGHALRYVDEVLVTVAPDVDGTQEMNVPDASSAAGPSILPGEDGSGGKRTADLPGSDGLLGSDNVPEPGILPDSDANMPSPGISPEAGGGDIPEPGILSGESVEVPQLEAPPKAGVDSMPDSSTLIQGPGRDGEADPFSSIGSEIKDAVDDLSRKLSEAQEDGVKFFAELKDAITGSITKVESSIKDAYDDVNGSILRTVKGAGDKVDPVPDKPGFSVDLTSPFRTGSPVNNALKEVVVFVGNGVGQAGHALSDVYSFAKRSAPTGIQSALDTAEEKFFVPASSILHQAFDAIVSLEKAVGIDPDNPIIPIVVVGGGTAYLGLLLWDLNYGGYSGDLSPTAVFDMLKNEKIVLVDVRQQELKERDGVPDLRRGARFKFASVSGLEVDRPVRDLLRSADAVDALLTATLIRNLKNVTAGSKVVVMDADGAESKKIAKALRRVGIRRSYRLEGGFAGWIKCGLGQKPEGQETPLQILKEETEAVVEDLKPAGIAAIALGSVVFIYALSEWEKTLQLLGVIAIIQLLYQRVNSYETAEELNADLRILLSPFRFVINLLGGESRTSKLELATSPSTTAVQDRVVQAAAKHGSKPDEEAPLEQEQEQQEQEEVTKVSIDQSRDQDSAQEKN